MKLATFENAGCVSPGIVVEDLVLDLYRARSIIDVARGLPNSMRHILELRKPGFARLAEIEQIVINETAVAAKLRAEAALVPLSSVVLHAPLADTRFILACGSNYAAHRKEMSGDIRPRPEFPTSFIKSVETIVGPGVPIILPSKHPAMVDWEGEICAVFSDTCHDITPAEALNYIAGYTIINDVSARDWLITGQPLAERNLLGKQFATFCPMGPFLVTKDEVSDPECLEVETWVNGEMMQRGNAKDWIFSLAELIAYYSLFYTFQPGDIISTGTPSGVGFSKNPKQFLKPGDVVEIRVVEIGALKNPVSNAPTRF